jgi:NAD+ synthetase
MPCHSSPASIARAEEVIKQFGLKRHFVDLAAAHDTIVSQVTPDIKKEEVTSRDRNWVYGALRSCLRAPTLDFVSKAYEGIIVGTGNRDEDEVTRYFQKRGDGCVDISPIAKFHKSEIYQLAQGLGVPVSVVTAVPSADLWGPDAGQEDEKELGIAYQEVEWAMQFAQKYSSIPLTTTGGVTAFQLRDALQMARKIGVEVSVRQAHVLTTLAHLEEISRHKANPALPVFDARVELSLDVELAAA